MPLAEAFRYFRRAMNMGAWAVAANAVRRGLPRGAGAALGTWALGGTVSRAGVISLTPNYSLGALRLGTLGAGLIGGYYGGRWALGTARRHPYAATAVAGLGLGFGAVAFRRNWWGFGSWMRGIFSSGAGRRAVARPVTTTRPVATINPAARRLWGVRYAGQRLATAAENEMAVGLRAAQWDEVYENLPRAALRAARGGRAVVATPRAGTGINRGRMVSPRSGGPVTGPGGVPIIGTAHSQRLAAEAERSALFRGAMSILTGGRL